MAADHLRIKSHERKYREKYMEHNHICTQGGSESIMKFSPQQVESPPPKPPRRRYSEQLSIPSLGAYSSNKKHNEGNQKSDSKSKRCSHAPAYLSLPANLTTSIPSECDDASNLLSYSFGLSDQLKHSKESEFYVKYFLDNMKFSESDARQAHSSNRLYNKEKLQSFNEHIFSKCQSENFETYTADKFLRNTISKSKTFMTSNCISQNLKLVNKDCHRRHNSDPAISHFNLQNDNPLKFEQEQCCKSVQYSSKKVDKYCDFVGSCFCCKKSYLIMQEIRILKEINEKLWQHLCSLQNYLENIRKKVYDDCADVSASGLLSSIYYAQKAKDCAMEERLKIVLEERDAALQELDDLVHVLTKSFNYTDDGKEIDKDTEEVLSEIGCSSNPSKFLKHQRMLLAQIHKLKGSKQDYFSYELRQAKAQRDKALEKVENLEEEIEDLKICYDLWHSDNKHWEVTIFDILSQVMQQRDTVVSKIDKGFDIGNVMYRSSLANRLDSIEHQNVSTFEPQSKTVESLKSHQTMHLSDYKQQHSYITSDEIKQLKEEVLLLNKALESEKRKREQSEGKCLKLERLIHILRKKLNGQKIGVPV